MGLQTKPNYPYPTVKYANNYFKWKSVENSEISSWKTGLILRSHIVCTKDTELLRETMQHATLNIVGTDLSAEQELPSYQQIEAMKYVDRDRYVDTFNTLLVNKYKSKQYQHRLSVFWNYHNSKTQQ